MLDSHEQRSGVASFADSVTVGDVVDDKASSGSCPIEKSGGTGEQV
jgi:hypothetical protein